MRTFHLALILLALTASATAACDRCAAICDLTRDRESLAREVIVRFRPDTPDLVRLEIRSDMGALFLRKFESIDASHYRLYRMTPTEAVAQFADSPWIEYIAPNGSLAYDRLPDDAYLDRQWSLINTGLPMGTPGADIDAPRAWDLAFDAGDVLVAVLDSGVDYTHPDLAANVWINPGEIPGNGLDDDANGYVDDVHGWDFFSNDDDPMDAAGHGTHVAGIVGATTDNGLGVAGVCWSANLMVLKIGDAEGADEASAIAAIEYAVAMGARVINASWGEYHASQALEDAVRFASDAGLLFIASSGNDGLDTDPHPHYPSGFDIPAVVAVAATDPWDELASFSNHGAVSVDLAAPGEDIYGLLPGSFGRLSGTSMAAPHVTGTAALLLARDPGLSAIDLKAAILGGVEVLPQLAGLVATGGRLDAHAALAGTATWSAALPPEDRPLLRVGPNPATTELRAAISLPGDGPVRLTLHDVTGRRVAVLLDAPRQAGRHEIDWRGEDLAAGVYLLRLESAGAVDARKLVILR